MQFLTLLYEDESRFANGFDPQEMAEFQAFGKNHAGAIKGGHALQPTQAARTVRVRNGQTLTTDGPFAETKEQLGGFGVFEATDLNHAIQLMSKHPSVKSGIVEIRPAQDLTEMIRESERRRSTKNS